MKIEHYICDKCGGEDLKIVKDGQFHRWYCNHCEKTTTVKSILKEVQDDKSNS